MNTSSNQSRWEDEDLYWRNTSRERDYGRNRDYETLQGGYRYGFESAREHRARTWQDVEPELERGWSTYQYRGESTWEQVKDAVRDAWHRVTGQSTR